MITKKHYSQIAFIFGWVLIFFSAELLPLGFPFYLIVIPATLLIIASAIEFAPRLYAALRDKWCK